MTEKPDLFWGLIASMWVGNLMLVVLNLPLIGMWVKLLTMPVPLPVPGDPALLLHRCVHVNNTCDRRPCCRRFGLLGYLLVKLDCEPAPLLLGFVLGPMMEENLRRAMLMSRGDPSVFVTRPISATLLVISGLLVVIVMMPAFAKKREEAFQEGPLV